MLEAAFCWVQSPLPSFVCVAGTKCPVIGLGLKRNSRDILGIRAIAMNNIQSPTARGLHDYELNTSFLGFGMRSKIC